MDNAGASAEAEAAGFNMELSRDRQTQPPDSERNPYDILLSSKSQNGKNTPVIK